LRPRRARPRPSRPSRIGHGHEAAANAARALGRAWCDRSHSFSTLSSPTVCSPLFLPPPFPPSTPCFRARCARPLATHAPCETFSWTPPPPISLLHRRWHPHTPLRSRGLNTTARPDAVSASVCAQWSRLEPVPPRLGAAFARARARPRVVPHTLFFDYIPR
jgi:hypothetical protein